MKISTIAKNIDTAFNKFQNSSIGKFLIEKVFFRKKSFYSILSSFGLILVVQLSVYNNVIKWADKVDTQMENAEGWSYLGWLFLSFIVPEGNLILIIMLIVLIIGAWIIRYRELNQEKSIKETLIKPLEEKTRNILFQIKMFIPFSGEKIELDRTDEIQSLKESLIDKQVIILSGEGGIGKTAIIKQLFEEKHEKDVFYVIKAIEFQDKNVLYGHNIQEFITIHENVDKKIFVVDSAEKLMDIEDTEFFKEFLSALIQNNWKVIFTTRYNYLDDLNYEFMENYQIKPYLIRIKKISIEKLEELSKKFIFNLPKDKKLKNLILNPFYLNEFLQTYNKNNEENYLSFKNKLWDKVIKKSHIDREECFLQLAYERANKGVFFIQSNCEKNTLKQLSNDGIISKEVAGYFITHDIYEEWALERIIEKTYINRENEKSFFENIGSSLSIRRSFRNWISEKLLLEDDDIKSFIENSIESNQIEQFWKDEILIAILLSDYSDTFFENFEKELFDDNANLLQRISFLLRIACKEVDNSVLEPYKLQVDEIEVFSMFNKPKGSGWKSFISTIYNHKDELGFKYIEFILPVLKEWQTKNQQGETTRKAALIALYYYDLINLETYKYGFDEYIKSICDVIIAGSYEIQDELRNIFEQIIMNKWKNHGDNYYKLSETILSTEYGFPKAFLILKYFPDQVLQLADLFWTYTPKEVHKGIFGGYDREDVETAFGIEKHNLRYFPSSALQTPIYYLLKLNPIGTIDFIIDFINKGVEKYVKSGWEEVKEIEIHIDNEITITQFHSQTLWNIYRGENSIDLLDSIHMALEKYLLEEAENFEKDTLERILAIIIAKSKSSSLTAVVASIILAYPHKTVNIALALLKTKELIVSDFYRRLNDERKQKDKYAPIGYGLNQFNKVYEEERVSSIKSKHRLEHLESICLRYQFYKYFDDTQIDKEAINKIIKDIYEILDNYYAELPPEVEQTESDKTWGIALARMDIRTMDVEAIKQEKGFQLILNPKLKPELKEYSEASQKEHSELFKYTSLYLWSKNRLEDNQDYKKYTEFEDTPLLALEQLKDLIKSSQEERSPILQKEIFSDTAIVLLRDFSELLKLEDKELCKDIILQFASMPFQKHYNYQISDGTDSAISHLSLLIDYFPDLKNEIKIVLLLNLFRDYEIGMSEINVHDSAIDAIVNFYENEEIENFIVSYLYLITKYKKIYRELREDNWHINETDVLEKFVENHQQEIERFLDNQISFEEIGDISNIGTRRLMVLMKIIAKSKVFENSENIDNILQQIIQVFIPLIFSDERNNDFETVHKFIDTFSKILLTTNKEKISTYLTPLIDNFAPTKDIAYLFTQIILLQDTVNNYENFWHIWSLFENKIIETCKNDRVWNVKEVIYAYMLVWSPYGAIWKKEAKEWHSLKEKNKKFFTRLTKELGQNPAVLYAISFLLNSIGSNYLNNGITWISFMIKHNDNLLEAELEINTIFYLEQLSRKYILNNMQEIKRSKSKKEEILTILNFLVERGSAIGYKLRENIL